MGTANTSRQNPHSLNAKTEKAMLGYAIAASAAGVSALALAQPAAAKIVYTPTNTVLVSPTRYNLDINNDGRADFAIVGQRYSFSRQGSSGRMYVIGYSNNEVAGKTVDASALPQKFQIGPSDGFTRGGSNGLPPGMLSCDRSANGATFPNGPWLNAKNEYLGLKIRVNGQIHYGWARLTVSHTACRITAALTGYAYETVPNMPIAAGKQSGPLESAELLPPIPPSTPLSLGVLARGSDGLLAWRREQFA